MRVRTRKDLIGPVGLLAAIISIGAGIYLLTSESASEETTVFDALFDGIGAYFIARGVWMVSALLRVPDTGESRDAEREARVERGQG